MDTDDAAVWTGARAVAEAQMVSVWEEGGAMGIPGHWRVRLSMMRAPGRLSVPWLLSLAGMMAVLVGAVLHVRASSPPAPHTAVVGRASATQPAPADSDYGRRLPYNASALAPAVPTGVPPTVQAVSAFLFDPVRGVILYQKNADMERSMASTAKVMTLLLAVELGDPNQLVTIGPDAAALVNSDNSYMGVTAGEQFTLDDLLYGLVLPSGNDAAVAVADAIDGSTPAFVALMNQQAQQLGLTHTHYISPDGLDDANTTSARDLAVLTSLLLRYPEAVRVTSTLHYQIPKSATHKAFDLWSGNDLLSGARSPYPGALGKPGFTYAARYCQAFAARRHGDAVVGAVLGDWSWKDRIADIRALLDWGFAQDGVPPAPAPVPWAEISPDA